MLFAGHGGEDARLSSRTCKSGTLALAGVPGAQVPAARASSVHSLPQQTRRQPPGVGGSAGAEDSGGGGGAGVGGLAHPPSPGRPPRFHLLRLSQPPSGLIRRGCAWRTLNIWIPGRPLPRPAPPGLGRRDPAARASSLRFVREPGNPAFSPPRSRPAPWGTANGSDQYLRFTGGKLSPQDPSAEPGFKPTHVNSRAPLAEAFHNYCYSFIPNKTLPQYFLATTL